MPDASASSELIDGQVLAAAIQHLAVADRVAVQQLQQKGPPACQGPTLASAIENFSMICLRAGEFPDDAWHTCPTDNERTMLQALRAVMVTQRWWIVMRYNINREHGHVTSSARRS